MVLRCPICGSEFQTENSLKKYCSAECAKIAAMESRKAYNEKNREMITRRRRERYEKNRESVLAERKDRYKNDPKYRRGRIEYARKYYRENAEEISRRRKIRRDEKKDAILSPDCGIPCSECERSSCPF